MTNKSKNLVQSFLTIIVPTNKIQTTVCNNSGRTKSSPSAAWKTLVSGTVKLFH